MGESKVADTTSMSTENAPPTLGVCPDCATEIASYDVLVEYERADGTPAVYAEYPGCQDVVNLISP